MPDLDKSLIELKEIEEIQKQKFPFEQKYMTPETYHQIIEKRKELFVKEMKSRSLFSWNLPEYLAYKKITAK